MRQFTRNCMRVVAAACVVAVLAVAFLVICLFTPTSHPRPRRKSRDRRPHRLGRFFRTASVVTLLAGGALVVSFGAFAAVVGIGEVQIASAHGGSDNLWHDWWFSLGVAGVALGLFVLILALASGGTQAWARRSFPDLQISIIGMRHDLPPLPPVLVAGSPIGITAEHLTVLIHNREMSRNASLVFLLVSDLDRPFMPELGTEWSFHSTEEGAWNVAPGLTDQRTLSFDTIPPDGFKLAHRQWQLNVTDIGSSRSVLLPVAGVFFDRTNWKAL